ncbi:hypothetical protein JCM14469_03370 [Desulfatiferula olefinivorans]
MKRMNCSMRVAVWIVFTVFLTAAAGFAASGPTLGTGAAKTAPAMGAGAMVTKDTVSSAMLRVTSFRKYEDTTGMMMAPGPMAGGAGASQASVDLGEDIELYWSIAFKNVGEPTVSINGERVTGERRTSSDGSFWMAGRKRVRPADTTNYVLSASAPEQKGGARSIQARETLRVIVKKPVLTLLQPTVNQETLAVTFKLKNTGDTDFRATPIQVGYEIEGGSLARGTVTTPPMEIRKNQIVDLYTVTLPDRARAFRTDSIRMRVNAGASYRQPLRAATADFTHAWEPGTFRINGLILDILSVATNCEILVDNWNEHHGSGRAITPPLQENASHVTIDILGNSMNQVFSMPHLQVSSPKKALKYRIYLRNIQAAHRGERGLFSIENGKLKISMTFPNTDAREIKIGRIGNLGDLAGKWIDDDAPDVDVSRFTLDVLLTPGIQGGKLTYTHVDVRITGLTASFPGGWSWLNPAFQDYATRVIRRNLDSSLTNILNSGSIKNAIIDGINRGITSAGVSITRITRIQGSGDTITVNYL